MQMRQIPFTGWAIHGSSTTIIVIVTLERIAAKKMTSPTQILQVDALPVMQ